MMNTAKTSKEQVEFWDSVLDDYEKGIYFLEIKTNNGIINKKIIIQ